MRTTRLAFLVSLATVFACSDDASETDPSLPGPPVPGEPSPGDGGDGDQGGELASTLSATCTPLQGRAIVHENGNLSVAFTENDDSYTFVGSVQWELPSGYTGSVPNPEQWDGSSDRLIVAVTSAAFELFGNHCWFDGTPPAQTGSVTVHAYSPLTGVVRATFVNYVLHSCVGAGTCTINGSIETTGTGVFE